LEELKVGDVVQLNSGGPEMAIKKFGDFSATNGPKDGVICQWRVGEDIKEGEFPRASLKKFDKAKKMKSVFDLNK